MSDPKFFKSRSDFHKWLLKNHASVDELLVGIYKKGSGQACMSYPEALDEALCFGWIDGVRKSIDEISYTIRFTPRRSGSYWSLVNIKRVGELEKFGLMQPSGTRAFDNSGSKRREYSYEQRERKLDAALEKLIRKNGKAWKFFSAQPPSYRRTAAWWVMSAKKDETRLRRLAKLIADSEKGKRLGVVTLKGEV